MKPLYGISFGYGGCAKPLYRKGFAMEAFQSPSIEGTLLGRLLEAPL